MSNNTETSNSNSKAPTHIAYHVREGKDKGFWTKIGVAWAHKDNKGFNIQLEVAPLDGRIQLRVATEQK
ncbi:hypothetical protein KIH39_22790 [Telmatocola sphagniphila]|uniref:Uncharacterized protein n=1 Tax=Telmatocola sphagniphila TaxID=1123043 RepID=A0A8E6EUS0_9BACT|nr:hypothetical protein [Telmatocola sphagniphila]QVL31642.1 hypothetical protein KIH39_22790 [Telmatocola sphagniphila]